MKTRVIITFILSVIYIAANLSLNLYFDSGGRGAANALQLTDSLSSNMASKAISHNWVENSIWYIFLLSLVVTWGSILIKKMKKSSIILVGLISLLSQGCMKPVKLLDPVEIKPNETAWAIPLDGESRSGQVKFNSVAFLNERKVSTKRIMIDKVERKTGRFYWEIEWIPATRIIKVDRSLVTREWTDGNKNGTSTKNEGIGVVTADSIRLLVGLTITASIDEDDASTYLYYHGERPLSDVLDQNIRSFAVAELTRKYSELTLADAQKEGNKIYSDLFKDAQVAFKTKGITIQYLGNAEGLTYADPKVQESINKSYTVQQDRATAQQEQEATKIRNQTLIMTAEANAKAAKLTFDAKEASELQTDLKIRQIMAEAQSEIAKKWSGVMPNIVMGQGANPLFMLGTNYTRGN